MKTSLLVLVLVAAAAAAWALDPPTPAPATGQQDAATSAEAPQDAPVVAEAAAEPASAVDQEELPPLPPGSRPTGPTPQRFTPTEKVRADFPISFPVDI